MDDAFDRLLVMILVFLSTCIATLGVLEVLSR